MPPAITTQPQPQTVNQGGTAAFSVSATGTTPLNYQWKFNGTNIGGATASSYTRNNAQPADAGSYSVVVTNVAGSVTSSNAMLTVNVPPVITGFSPAAGPPGTNVTLTGANFLGATAVLLNGLPLQATPTNNSTLQFAVPANATTGPIRLNAPAGSFTTASNLKKKK
jgi:hypothetical protein